MNFEGCSQVSVLLELVVRVNNSRWPRVLLYLAARLTTVSLDRVTNVAKLLMPDLYLLYKGGYTKELNGCSV